MPPEALVLEVTETSVIANLEGTKRVVEEGFARRDWQVIARYGRFLDPILDRIAAESPLMAKQVEAFRMNTPGSIRAGACP